MTNRQSNFIFYSVITLIVCAIVTHFAAPNFFENLTKSTTELSINEALENGEHKIALSLYQQLLDESSDKENKPDDKTAAIYSDMAKLHSFLGNRSEEKKYYLKALTLKESLKKTSVLSIIEIYDKLGSFAEDEKKYDEAQMYYEKSLSKKLGSDEIKDKGLFVGMQNTRENYKRLNNEMTINTFKKLAEIHQIKREYEISKNYYEKALSASKLTFGEDDPKTLELQNLMNQ